MSPNSAPIPESLVPADPGRPSTDVEHESGLPIDTPPEAPEDDAIDGGVETPADGVEREAEPEGMPPDAIGTHQWDADEIVEAGRVVDVERPG